MLPAFRDLNRLRPETRQAPQRHSERFPLLRSERLFWKGFESMILAGFSNDRHGE